MEKGNEVATSGSAVRQASAEPASTAGQGSGGQQTDSTRGTNLFTNPDGSPLTPEELRAEADDTAAFADGIENNRKRAVDAGEQDAEYLADKQRSIDQFRGQAAAMRQEADRLEQASSSSTGVADGPSSGQPADQAEERELPSGSITNPDGTRTEIERLSDGTFRESTLDAEGNVLSSRLRERLPGDWARSEHTDGS